MTYSLVDIRQMGSVKHQIPNLSNHLQEKFNIGDKLVTPLTTLAGPFSTQDEKKLIEDFTRICSNQKEIPKYEVGSYGFFDGLKVVFVTIPPDDNLKQFRFSYPGQSPHIAHYGTMIWILPTNSGSTLRWQRNLTGSPSRE